MRVVKRYVSGWAQGATIWLNNEHSVHSVHYSVLGQNWSITAVQISKSFAHETYWSLTYRDIAALPMVMSRSWKEEVAMTKRWEE